MLFSVCGYLCHQIPERSFFLAGYQFPLCYRCTGLLLGTCVFLVLVYFRRTFSIRLAGLLLAPMLIDVGLQILQWWEGENTIRLLTGFAAGAGLPVLLLEIIFKATKQSPRVYKNA